MSQSAVCSKCMANLDVFCCICGKYTLEQRRVKITEFVKKVYYAYFGVKLGDQDKPWVSHVACKSCIEHLREWTHKKRKTRLAFALESPMFWREPSNHLNDCYFCMVHVAGKSSRTLSKVEYSSIPSVIRPVSHSNDLPVPIFQGFEDCV